MPSNYTPKQFLEDPLIDKGNSIQAFAKRHARLYIHMNVWHEPPEWIGAMLEERTLRQWYAFRLYSRLVQRYGVVCPLPDDSQVVEPMWWERDVIATDQVQETETQGLARMLYIAAFTYELGMYGWSYLGKYCGRWTRRVHELELAARRSD